MQKLTFESAWDKTIAEKDREQIKQSFKEACLTPGINIQFTALWQAKNHRGELLVAVLIHNTSQQDFSFHNQKMTYTVNDTIFATHSFSPSIIVEKETSMPWTFIFPASSFDRFGNFEGGVLDIEVV